jgi:coenzyme F420-reducing hydrogenase beta subunit
MTYNREGYFNPTIDTEKCVNCGICEAHCPVFQLSKRNQDPLKAYASWINDDRIRKASSSGGIFSAIAQNILSQGGIVWGTGYSEDMTPIYKRVENAKALYEIQGSKYVQCKIGGCYKEIREELKDGRKVLFCGTPCHVAGL